MPWHKYITNNFGWKLASALLATVVWLLAHYNADEHQTTRVFEDVPVAILAPADEPSLFQVEPRSVRLAVRGSESVVGRLEPGEVHVFVSLLDHASSRSTFRYVEADLPSGLTLAWISPRQVRVERRAVEPMASANPNPSP